MAAEDWLPIEEAYHLDIGEEDFEYWTAGQGYMRPRPVTCERCGAKNLAWINRRGVWLLLNPDGQDHCCASVDDFEAFE